MKGMMHGLLRESDVNSMSTNRRNSLDFKTCSDPEFVLRTLFNQIILVECSAPDSQPQNWSMAINFLPGPSPDGVLVEFSNILSHWIWKLCGGYNANDQSRDQIDRLICKILNEKIPKYKGSYDLCNMKGLGAMDPPLILPPLPCDSSQWNCEEGRLPCDSSQRNCEQGRLPCDSSQRNCEQGRVAVTDMVMWLRGVVALDPGGVTQSLNLGDPKVGKQWKLVVLTRQVLLQATQSLLDECDFPYQKKPRIESRKSNDALNLVKRRSQRNVNLPKSCKRQFERKRIPIGCFFQADVPDWTGPETEGAVVDNKRWLGHCMWPVRGIDMVAPLEKPIGEGRGNARSCSPTRSLECIKYHIIDFLGEDR